MPAPPPRVTHMRACVLGAARQGARGSRQPPGPPPRTQGLARAVAQHEVLPEVEQAAWAGDFTAAEADIVAASAVVNDVVSEELTATAAELDDAGEVRIT